MRGMTGYAYGSPTSGSTEQTTGADKAAITAVIDLSQAGGVSDTEAKLLNFDADILSRNSGAVIVLDVVKTAFIQGDFNNLSAFAIDDIQEQADTDGSVSYTHLTLPTTPVV